MSRIYVCDRCGAKFNNWSTTNIEIPSGSFLGGNWDFELCHSCIVALRNWVKKFMEEV